MPRLYTWHKLRSNLSDHVSPVSLRMTFPLHCFQVLLLPLSTSLSCLPGKWLMPITGRGGSPTTRTGSCAKTPASSTWSIQWACGSTRTDNVRHIVITDKKVTCYLLLPMHHEVFKSNMLMINIRVHGLQSWGMARRPATPLRFLWHRRAVTHPWKHPVGSPSSCLSKLGCQGNNRTTPM